MVPEIQYIISANKGNILYSLFILFNFRLTITLLTSSSISSILDLRKQAKMPSEKIILHVTNADKHGYDNSLNYYSAYVRYVCPYKVNDILASHFNFKQHLKA